MCTTVHLKMDACDSLLLSEVPLSVRASLPSTNVLDTTESSASFVIVLV